MMRYPAQTARELLLMQVHDCKRPVRRIGLGRVVERQGNLPDADLRKEQRAQAVELRHGERLAGTRMNHLPQQWLRIGLAIRSEESRSLSSD
ncbi:hypothetical protein [Bradyrhizobium sp. USDA 4486]